MNGKSHRRLARAVIGLIVSCTLATALAAETPTPDEIREMLRAERYAEAETAARIALAAQEREHETDSVATADALDLLAQALYLGGKAGQPETRPLAERALKIRESKLPPDSADVATSLHTLASVLARIGKYAEAGADFERAISIREKALGRDHLDVAKSLLGLGWVRQTMGDYAAAKPLYERALTIQETRLGPEHPDVTGSLGSLGWLLMSMGDYARSRSLYERAVAIREKSYGPDDVELGRKFIRLGEISQLTGDYVAARSFYERALTTFRDRTGPTRFHYATTLSDLGWLLETMGDYGGARPLYEQALRIIEELRGPDHPDVAWSLTNLAWLLRDSADYGSARPLYERALKIREDAFGPEHPDVATSASDLAGLLHAMGEDANARKLYERAVKTLEATADPEDPRLADVLQSYAELLEDEGEAAGALDACRRALTIRETVFGADHPHLAGVLEDEATLYYETNEPQQALDAALRVERMGREQVLLTTRTLVERQALGYAAIRPTGLDVVLSVAARGIDSGVTSRAWDETIRSRALVLDEMTSRHRAVSGAYGSDVARLVDDFDMARRRMANLTVRGLGKEDPALYRKLLDEARGEAERAERALAEKSLVFRDEQKAARVGLEEVKAHLPEETALVAFVLYEKLEAKARGATVGPGARSAKRVPSYLAFILAAAGDPPILVSLGAASRIDALVRDWHREARTAPRASRAASTADESRYREVGARLREAIWDPVASHLGGARQVLIVPDGVLHLMSFATLPVGKRQYLIETGPILHYLSTERDLVLAGRKRSNRGLLAMGASAFDENPDPVPVDGSPAAVAGLRGTRSACGDLASLVFAPLPGAAIEADTVASLWPAGASAEELVKLTGAAATESAFKRNAPGKRVLHLATHGFFVNGKCKSALDVATTRSLDPSGRDHPPVLGDNPLLLSGLAFAGANRRGSIDTERDDGMLTADEVASLDLTGVEWAVLSACETGVGEIRAGEGVLGLRRAFQTAGVGTLITSLWRVDDFSTLAWMRNLYEGRGAGLETSEAVRRASVAMIESSRREHRSTHPFSWGAFVAAGNFR